MSLFHLPIIHVRYDLPCMLSASFLNMNGHKVNRTFMVYLNNLKTKIRDNASKWSEYRHLANPYEFIHRNVPNTTQSVSSLNPISYSYYKMVEINNTFKLLDENAEMTTFHLAEGIGGGVESICEHHQNSKDKHYLVTLNQSSKTVNDLNVTSAFLNANSVVEIDPIVSDCEKGITSPKNLMYCFEKYHGTMDLVTCDIGIDNSVDFILQEDITSNTTMCQVAFGCAVLKEGGAFVIKVFDISTFFSVDVIYFLSLAFDSVHVFKPSTTPGMSSERYIVCKGFRFASNRQIIHFFSQIMNHSVSRIFNSEIPYFYLSKIEECNAIIGQQQIENILFTLSLLDNPKPRRLETIIRRHVVACEKWCAKYGISTNEVTSNNIFTQQCT